MAGERLLKKYEEWRARRYGNAEQQEQQETNVFSNLEDPKCRLYPYQISRCQVGVGAAAITPTSATVALGQPLIAEEYGNSLKSINLEKGILYKDDDFRLATQDFIEIDSQGVVDDALVTVWVLDEDTANGQNIDEAGLFVYNPYLYTVPEGQLANASPGVSLVGEPSYGIPGISLATSIKYQPGHFLAAYRQFTPIKKQGYFSLMFRWSITFEGA